MTARWWMTFGSLSALLSVSAGAFGAHALRARLTIDRLAIFETAARYQMYHALGLIVAAMLLDRATATGGNFQAQSAAWSFALGTLFFCGSLYLLVLTDRRWLGAITPIGGLGFIFGWLMLAIAAWRTLK